MLVPLIVRPLVPAGKLFLLLVGRQSLQHGGGEPRVLTKLLPECLTIRGVGINGPVADCLHDMLPLLSIRALIILSGKNMATPVGPLHLIFLTPLPFIFLGLDRGGWIVVFVFTRAASSPFRLPASAAIDTLMQGAMTLDDDCKSFEEHGLDPERNLVVIIRGVSQAP